MSILDASVFYGCWPFRNAGTEDFSAIEARCAGNGVDHMLVSSVNAIFYEDPFEAEIKLHNAIASAPNAHHVLSVNPMAAGWQDDLREAVSDFAIAGIKLFPGYHGYSLQGPEIAKVCELAGKYDLPIILCSVVEDVRVAYMLRPAPLALDKVGVFLGTYRDNTVMLSNFSFGEVMNLRPNLLSRERVYIDTAGFKFISFPIEKLLKVYPKEMLIFGSQCPLYVQRSILNEITIGPISEDVQRAILFENAARVFKL